MVRNVEIERGEGGGRLDGVREEVGKKRLVPLRFYASSFAFPDRKTGMQGGPKASTTVAAAEQSTDVCLQDGNFRQKFRSQKEFISALLLHFVRLNRCRLISGAVT